MMNARPSSPSAHFYTKRGGSSATQQRAFDMDDSPGYFDHVQDLTAHDTGRQRMYQVGLHGNQIPEEMISPRMPIHNPLPLEAPPCPGPPGLGGNSEDVLPRMHRHTWDQRGVGDVTSYDTSSPTHYQSLPPLPIMSSVFDPNSIFPAHCSFVPIHQEDQGLPPAHHQNNISRTILVPSASELSSASGSFYEDRAMRPVDHDPKNNGAGRTQGTIIGPLVFGHNDSRRRASAVLRPSEATHHQQQQQGGGNGKQHSLTPTTRSSFVSSTTTGREDRLANDVVEVHDVCLLVTQRYLDARRVNWQLRHGREEAVVTGSTAAAAGVVMGQRLAFGRTLRRTRRRGGLTGDGGGGHHRKARKQRRGGQRSSRRVLHEDRYYLAASESSSRGDEDDDSTAMNSDRRGRRRCPPQNNNSNNNRRSPIPWPTDSLLQNIHSICDLIWRRARRDRADVLGAEVQGCRAMQVLQESGETIVLHDAGAFSRNPEGCFARVLGSGRAICRELGDWEALRVMESWEEKEQEAAEEQQQQPGVLI